MEGQTPSPYPLAFLFSFPLLPFYLNNTLLRGKKTSICFFGEIPFIQHSQGRRHPTTKSGPCNFHLNCFPVCNGTIAQCILFFLYSIFLNWLCWTDSPFFFFWMIQGSHNLRLNVWSTDTMSCNSWSPQRVQTACPCTNTTPDCSVFSILTLACMVFLSPFTVRLSHLTFLCCVFLPLLPFLQTGQSEWQSLLGLCGWNSLSFSDR